MTSKGAGSFAPAPALPAGIRLQPRCFIFRIEARRFQNQPGRLSRPNVLIKTTEPHGVSSGLVNLGVSIGLIFAFIPGIVISLAWSLTLLLVIDKRKNPTEAITIRNNCTYGYKGRMFGIYLLTGIGFAVASFILTGIGAAALRPHWFYKTMIA